MKEPCQDVLDCGCGTGAMLVMFRDACPDKQYIGIDLSKKMIEVANRRAVNSQRYDLKQRFHYCGEYGMDR